MVEQTVDEDENFELTENELDEIADLMSRLLIQSHEDGIVGDDESALLFDIKSNLKKYVRLLRKAATDGTIDEGEKLVLEEFRRKIVEDAYTIARKDRVITKDERDLIMILIRKLIRDRNGKTPE